MKRLLLAYIALLSLLLTGCGSGGGNGIETTVLDNYGRPIPGANVSVVMLPPGGLDELERMVSDNMPLYGWHFKSDKNGQVQLKGIPTGGYNVKVDETAMALATAAGAIDPANAGKYSSEVLEAARRNAQYVPGEPLGIIVFASGFKTWIGSATFNSPNGKLRSIMLSSYSGYFPEIKGRSVKVSLESLSFTPLISSVNRLTYSQTLPYSTGSSTGRKRVHGYMWSDGCFSDNYSPKPNYNPYPGRIETCVSPPTRTYRIHQ